ncbi:hypothetical protein COHA_002225 [Chlorella ohadii]|uniref:Gamma-butyrobetaine hydroxylase-like N-terminal domain-containing protein n=1 Tax=Chlorella ohadii TaxID=2649997 RepID=A0AAD5H4K7_9CHLO|nr:hypothetical protein COHA_002225 [Chlorella ohadii]
MAALSAAALLLRGPLGARALSTAADQLWATAIKYRSADKVLEVEFSTGERFSYPAEYLRVHSPAAEARDRQGGPKVVAGRRHVGLVGVHPVGSYAVRLEFDDLHGTGIYTWPYLHDLGQHKLSRMRQYIQTLRERGLTREPPSLRKRRPAAAGGQQQSAAREPQQPGAGSGEQQPASGQQQQRAAGSAQQWQSAAGSEQRQEQEQRNISSSGAAGS